MRSGITLLITSIFTRLGVILLLCGFALMTEYLNLKQAYNNPRLVELSSGKAVRICYQAADKFFGWFGDPLKVAQTNGGMTWSIRVMGLPFTDPIAALSVLAKRHRLEWGFAIGLAVPLALAFTFGRIFCAYICPASLFFFTIARVRGWLSRWFYFPEVSLHRGFAWGVMLGGMTLAVWLGHGIWSLILPYFAIGQTIFHGIAMGTLSTALGSVVVFAAADFVMGRQFTCRYLCPTGRLLGWLGRRSLISIRRDATRCIESCQSCAEVCPMKVSPKRDQTVDCSLCGECLVVCPTHCLSVGPRPSGRGPRPFSGAAYHGKRSTLVRTGAETVGNRLRSSLGQVQARLLALCLLSPLILHAHHFKGLPHYDYFKNYPQVPQEEFLGQAGDYEMSLVVYDFQGIDRKDVEGPDTVRLFLVIFNLRDNRVYKSALTMQIFDRGREVFSQRFERAELENLYSIYHRLPDSGKYALRIVLHDENDLETRIPFRLSSQKINWGKWVAGALVVCITVAAVGARKKRMMMDRKEAHQRRVKKEAAAHA